MISPSVASLLFGAGAPDETLQKHAATPFTKTTFGGPEGTVMDFPADAADLAVPPPQVVNFEADPADTAPISSPRTRMAAAGHASKAAAAAPAMPSLADAAFTPTANRDEGPDPFLDEFKSRRSKAEKSRDAALARAEAEGKYTDEEKLASALIAALPALLGAGLGGALAGGAGATAGLAGGLQGSAQGLGQMQAAKGDRRKEALAKAAGEEGRLDKLGDQELGRMGEKDQRKFAVRMKDDERSFEDRMKSNDRKFHEGESAKDRALRISEGARDRAAHRGDIVTQGKQAYELERLRAAADLQGKLLQKKAEKDKTGDTLGVNVSMANDLLNKLEAAVKENGTWESSYMGDEKTASTFDSVPYQLAITYAKIVDPDSVAREGEVAAAQKYLIKLGMFSNKKEALAGIEHYRQSVNGYANTREGRPTGIDTGKPSGGAAQKGSQQPTSLQGKYGF